MEHSGRARTITREILQETMADMRRLAETRKPNGALPRAVTRPQLIRTLRGEIAAIFKQGYDIEDVIELLGQHGIQIDFETFRRYWRRSKRARSNREPSEAPSLGEIEKSS